MTNMFIAGTLSVLMPGLGQIYNGEFLKGIFIYVITNILMLIMGLGIFVWMINIIDAMITANN